MQVDDDAVADARQALATMSIASDVQHLGHLYVDQWLNPTESDGLPPGVDEDDGYGRFIDKVNFEGTLRQLQEQILQAMHSFDIDRNLKPESYIITHRQCEPSSTYCCLQTGCNCFMKQKNTRELITGRNPATATLTELGMVPGHWVYVTTEWTDPSNV